MCAGNAGHGHEPWFRWVVARCVGQEGVRAVGHDVCKVVRGVVRPVLHLRTLQGSTAQHPLMPRPSHQHLRAPTALQAHGHLEHGMRLCYPTAWCQPVRRPRHAACVRRPPCAGRRTVRRATRAERHVLRSPSRRCRTRRSRSTGSCRRGRASRSNPAGCATGASLGCRSCLGTGTGTGEGGPW